MSACCHLASVKALPFVRNENFSAPSLSYRHRLWLVRWDSCPGRKVLKFDFIIRPLLAETENKNFGFCPRFRRGGWPVFAGASNMIFHQSVFGGELDFVD